MTIARIIRGLHISGGAQTGFKNQRTAIIYTTPALALAGSTSGDNIQVLPGIYTGSVKIAVALAVISFTAYTAGSLPVMDWSGFDKGTFNRTHTGAGSITLDGIDFRGYIGVDGNESVCREEDHTGVYIMTMKRGIVSGFGTGLLVGNNTSDKVILEDMIFTDNGDDSGSTHNVYIGNVAEATFLGVYSTNCAGGHLIKSRAYKNTMHASRLWGGNTVDCARELEFPCGGDNNVYSTVIHQTADIAGGSNNEIASNANESAGTLAANCVLTGRSQGINYFNCTFVNERSSATFFTNGGSGITAPTQVRTDNVMVGTSAPVVAGNTNGALSLLVDAANNNYQMVTPVLGSGANAPYEYVHPGQHRDRTDSYRGAVAPAGQVFVKVMSDSLTIADNLTLSGRIIRRTLSDSISVIDEVVKISLEPTWITSALGATPTLNQAINLGTDIFNNYASTIFQSEGISAIIGDYGPSLVVTDDGRVIIWNGGHAGTDNNVVIGQNTSINNPVFYTLRARSVGARPDAAKNNADGTPTLPHSYAQNVWHQGLNRFLAVRRSYTQFDTSGTIWSDVRGFNPDSGTWDADGTYPDVGGVASDSETPACVDDLNNVFSFKSDGLWKAAQSGSTLTAFTNVNTDGDKWYGTTLAFDKVRRRLYCFGANAGNTRAPTYALESEGYSTWHTLTLSGAPGNMNTDIWGVVYDDYVDCLWISDDYTSRASYRKVTFTNTSTSSGATIGSAGVWSGVTFNTTGGGNNVALWRPAAYCRVRRGVICIAGTGAGTYFIRTSNPP